MEIPTPADVANLVVNLPIKLRTYVIEAVPMNVLLMACLCLKNRTILKKDFVHAVQVGCDLWVLERAEAKEKLDRIDGFEVGQRKVCHCEYWEGRVVEVVNTEMTHWGHHAIHIKYDGIVYKYFRPEWLGDT